MESQPQNPEFRTNPEHFHSCLLCPLQIHRDHASVHVTVCDVCSIILLVSDQLHLISFKIYRRVKHCKIHVNLEFGDHLHNSD